jgi:uncharacterized OB-fold protein
MLHAVIVGSPLEMKTGMRVTAQWKEDRVGHIADLEGFVQEIEKADS